MRFAYFFCQAYANQERCSEIIILKSIKLLTQFNPSYAGIVIGCISQS